MNVITRRNLGNLKVTGNVRVNGHAMRSDIMNIASYCQQHDLFVGAMKVQEHLWFNVSKFAFVIVTCVCLNLYKPNERISRNTDRCVLYTSLGLAYHLFSFPACPPAKSLENIGNFLVAPDDTRPWWNTWSSRSPWGTGVAQLVARSTPDRCVVGSSPTRGTEHFGFPPSAPRLGNQRPWYVQPRLCDWAYKRYRVTYRKKKGIVSRWSVSS